MAPSAFSICGLLAGCGRVGFDRRHGLRRRCSAGHLRLCDHQLARLYYDAPHHKEAYMNDLDLLKELNRDYVRSVLESDVRWFEANLAEDFQNSNPDGTLVDRAGFLKQIAPPCTLS